MAFDFTPFPGADPTECAGNVTNGCLNPNNPQYRHRFLATWETPLNIEATATWRYFSSTDNPAGPAATGVDGGLDSVNYLDLSFNYEVTEFFRLRAGALNVLNRQAPVFTAAGPPLGNGNTFPTIYDTGRFVFFGGTLTY
jgi:outer membrane receptor protein involved in Fe transport